MFYQIEKLSQRVTRLWDVSHTAMYLIEGDECALLADTGTGVGSLRDTVAALTDKPITVVLTHGHVDHACGAGAFETVYLHSADLPVYEEHRKLAVRQGYVANSAGMGGNRDLLAKVQEQDYQPTREVDGFLPLEAGMCFPLGGETVQVLAAPGHTPGTVALLLKEERTLLLGDACNGFTFLFYEYSSSVAQYREDLLALKAATDGKYDRTLFSHGSGNGCIDMINRVIAVCDDILSGKTDNVPFRGSDGTPACIAKAMNFARFCRADGGEGNIIYNPQKIR